ncbi:arylsulfatase [Parapedobacter sp. 2B3]|uniref:sulfatase family protein n=1 Tax=Parapedobacter sp. 2B3 TaxID=3342381 RepID=UPI0035B5740B
MRKPLCFFLISLAMASAGAQNIPGPNIVLIVADDLGYNDLSSYGQSRFLTPHTNRLSKEGVRFTAAYSPSAVCSPTRYAIMTGTDPFRSYHHSHVLFNGEPLVIKKDQMTIASFLKKCGYVTGIVGKWHLGLGDAMPRDINEPGRGPNDVGFDYSYIVPDGHNMYPRYYIENGKPVVEPGITFDSEAVMLDRVGYKLVQHRPKGEWPNLRPDSTIGRRLVDKAVEFIETQKKPFFLYLPACAIHFPLAPDKEFVGRSGIGKHGDFVLEFDWLVGEVMQALDRNKIAGNTLLIVTSDNGGYGPLVSFDHNPAFPWRGKKGDAWEGGTRVPFIARWPNHIARGRISHERISLVDCFATMAAITGSTLPRDAALDSFSFLQLLLHAGAQSDRPYLVTGTRGMKQMAIREGKWKLIFEPETDKAQLYDIVTDPEENNEVSGSNPQMTMYLKSTIKNYLESGSSRPGAAGATKSVKELFREREARNQFISDELKHQI